MDARSRDALLWVAPLAASLLGLTLTAAGVVGLGLWLSLAANAVLLARAHATVRRRPGLGWGSQWLAMVLGFAGGSIVLVAAAALDGDPWNDARRVLIVIMTSGAQLYLLGQSIDPRHGANQRGRLLLPILGHAIVLLAASLLVLDLSMPETTAALGYFTGFTLILLHAYWIDLDWASEKRRGAVTGLEIAFMASLGVSLTLLALDSTLGIATWLGDTRLTELVGRGGFVIALALFVTPPSADDRVVATPGGLRQFLAQALVVVLILNALVLAMFFISTPLAYATYLGLTAWLTVAVMFEYTSVIHGIIKRIRGPRDPEAPPEGADVPITVVVSAMNDAGVLKHATERNLALPLSLQFLLVVSRRSKDDTVAVARDLARRHPTRVRVFVCENASKAEDLNAAWPSVKTDLVLLLDADEVLAPDAVAQGLRVLNTRPEVGIVQGRKASSYSVRTRPSFFAVAERRFSTVLDQSVQSDIFGAAHFAGSVALMRREVPMSVDGWSPVTLTEDIEFTMRIHLANRWRIVYEPRMVAVESDPATMGALVRQRVRWARGWGEVYSLHFTRVLAATPRIGIRRATGLTWQLITSVSAPWAVFLPALGLLAITDRAPGLATLTAITLAVLILPSRLLSFGVAALVDPLIKTRRERIRGALLGGLAGYGWIIFGWLIQLHALYLEVSAAPRTWYATRKAETLADGEDAVLPA